MALWVHGFMKHSNVRMILIKMFRVKMSATGDAKQFF